MYLDHFGFTEAPFRATPPNEFFFAGANRGLTLDALLYAIINDEGIVNVSGEVASGKTMLCRMLMQRLPPAVETIYLASPAPVGQLQEQLLRPSLAGKQIVVLVDDAHAMPVATLEQIRLLANLESKRLQLVLCGQPALNEVLARAEMRQLKERITHNFHLEPLLRKEVAEYIEFRLRAAGYQAANPFTPAAARLIAEASRGLPGRIDLLADKALLASFSIGSHQVTPKQVKAAIAECDFSAATAPRRHLHPAWMTAGLLGILVFAYIWGGGSAPGATPGVTEPPTAVAAPPPPLVTEPVASGISEKLLVASRDWLSAAPGDRWFLQLQTADAAQAAKIEAYLQDFQAAGGDLTQLRLYKSGLSGRLRYGVIYGDFATMTEAQTAVLTLPASIRAGHPFPRQVRQLR